MKHIRVSDEGAVGLLTIDRPRALQLARRARPRTTSARPASQLARDREVRAVVLRGTRGVFCSGADLKYIRAGGDAVGPRLPAPRSGGGREGYGEVFKQILEYIHSTISEIRRAPKPFIAAVDGVAAAGGLGLAHAATSWSRPSDRPFEWAYGKTGLTGAESSTFFLPRLVGLRRAMDLALLNPRLDAREAQGTGPRQLRLPPTPRSTARSWRSRRASRGADRAPTP